MGLRTCIGRAYQRFFLASKSSAGATQSAAVVAATSSGFCFDNTAHNRTDRQMKGGKEARKEGRKQASKQARKEGRREGKTGPGQTYKKDLSRQARDRHIKQVCQDRLGTDTYEKGKRRKTRAKSDMQIINHTWSVAACARRPVYKKEENTSHQNQENRNALHK